MAADEYSYSSEYTLDDESFGSRDYVSTNEKLNEVMGKVTDVLTKEILMGDAEEYATAGFAERLMDQLSTSINGLLAMQDKTASSPTKEDAYRDQKLKEGGSPVFSDNESEMGYGPLTPEEVAKRHKPEKKSFTLKEWEQNYLKRMRERESAAGRLTQDKLKKEKDLTEFLRREEERKRKNIMRQAGYNFQNDFSQDRPLLTFKDWKDTFGKRLEVAAAHKQETLSKTKQKLTKADKERHRKNRPARLKKTMTPGIVKWTNCDCKEICNCDGGREVTYETPINCPEEREPAPDLEGVLNDQRDVYKRLYVASKRKTKNHYKKLEQAKLEKAQRELEECFFTPQLLKKGSGSRQPKYFRIPGEGPAPGYRAPPAPSVRDPKRELGYEPGQSYQKVPVTADEFPFSPRINKRSRQMVDENLYRNAMEVSNRLASAERRPSPDVSQNTTEQQQAAEATFTPAINQRSREMARDIEVFDRLYNIGMQQILERKRMQSEFWDNYTRLDRPLGLRLPSDPFGTGGQDDFDQFGSGQYGEPYGGYGQSPGGAGYPTGGEGDFQGDMTRIPMDVTRSGGGLTPGSHHGGGGFTQQDPLGYSGSEYDAPESPKMPQDVAIGMSPAEFLAVYGSR